MEGKKMEGKGTTGAERRLSYPAAAKDQGHVHQPSTEEMSGTQTTKFGWCCSCFNSVSSTHTTTHTHTVSGRLPAPCGAPAERGHVRHQLPSRQLFFSHNSTQLRLSAANPPPPQKKSTSHWPLTLTETCTYL